MKSVITLAAAIALATLPTLVLAASPAAKKPVQSETTGSSASNDSGDIVGSISPQNGGAISPQVPGFRPAPLRELSCARDALGKSTCETNRL